ncbi:hypothetical protein G7Z17_g1719 [Cylindrodendrum hubeiense]|uniref:Uncharacterized protein n=1 Tax=Cylindrodendrum hubeiense TaxID=595255 RepID=A0A9P5HHX7_9HYPO|nr:hypothetical protein G7Z17_g1719 [Cylindrodendrum hubeiense]
MSHRVASDLRALHLVSKAEMKRLDPKSPPSWMDTRAFNFDQKYQMATTASEQPVIPNPSLFQLLSQRNAISDQLPTTAQCAAHLELLEVFYALRVRVVRASELNDAFGLEINNKIIYRRGYDASESKYIYEPHKLKDITWDDQHREKWPYYLNFAAARFLDWAKKIDDVIGTSRAAGTIDGQSTHTDAVSLPYLPPLDVLMVWHAFLLNPSDFAQFCKKNSLKWLRQLPFPWPQMHANIDSDTWSYTLPAASLAWLKDEAYLEPNLFDFLVDLGQSKNAISATLSENNAKTISSNQALAQARDIDAMTVREKAFLESLHMIAIATDQVKALVDNVQRQAAFVDKMHRQLWIRSPAVADTIQRATERYEQFLKLFRLCPGQMLVPTLDIDLVWHTHQLSAQDYAAAMLSRTGRFIDHDDKLGKPTLNDALEETVKLFSIHFGHSYSICLCWECEAILSAVQACDEDDDSDADQFTQLAGKVMRKVDYYRAVELSRRNGNHFHPVSSLAK